jgi:hypothetical protein
MGVQKFDALAAKQFIPFGGGGSDVPEFGMYQKSDGNIGFAIGGSLAFTIDSEGGSPASGGGGTVEAGTTGQFAYYAADGTTVSGTASPGYAAGTDFGAIITAAAAGGYVAQLNPAVAYTISAPINIQINANITRWGVNGNGAKIQSLITTSEDVWTISIPTGDSDVNLEFLYLANFQLGGSGTDGNGLTIISESSASYIYNFIMDALTIRSFGGAGCVLTGSNFENQITNCWFNDNVSDGLQMNEGTSGGVVSAMHWNGGGARNNGGQGVNLANYGPYDLHIWGCYFVQNTGAGVSATNGINSIMACGFENNGGQGVYMTNFCTIVGCTFSSYGPQTDGVYATIFNRVIMYGCAYTYYGSGSPGQLLQVAGGGIIVCDTDDAILTDNTPGQWINASGVRQVPPTVVNASTYTVLPTDRSIIFTAACVVTFGEYFAGRILDFRVVGNFAITSANDDVVPLTSSATGGTPILAATSGKWATLVGNGAQKVIMAAN